MRVFKIKGPTVKVEKTEDASGDDKEPDEENDSEECSESEEEQQEQEDESEMGEAVLIETFPLEPIEEEQSEVKEEIKVEIEPGDVKEEDHDQDAVDKDLIPLCPQYSVTTSGKRRMYKQSYK